MRAFKDLYLVVSYCLFIVQLGFVSIFLYNRYIYHRALYYGGDKPIDQISANYFYVLKTLFYSTLVLVILWAVMTPLAVLANKRGTSEDEHIEMTKGILGFVVAVALLITDPFGMFKWFSK